MRLLTVTDAWHPQVSGVVRTIEATNAELRRAGHEPCLITPQSFLTLPCPGYREIGLALLPYRKVAAEIDRLRGEPGALAIHVATEGPLGLAARRYCLRQRLPFTTAYHTRYPQYLKAMFGVPPAWTYAFLRRFHGAAQCVLSPTAEVDRELAAIGLRRVARWTRGVDLAAFAPIAGPRLEHSGAGPRQEHSGASASELVAGLARPLFLYVGRVSVEKNIEAFLRLDLPGTKIVAGSGPALDLLRRRFPETHFLGVLEREALARLYSSADAFVFPSRTDTFGLVLLEALACGLPVAAYPVQGPLDVLAGCDAAVLDEDLRRAALAALRIDRGRCRAWAQLHSWRAASEQFLAHQVPLPARLPAAAAGAAQVRH